MSSTPVHLRIETGDASGEIFEITGRVEAVEVGPGYFVYQITEADGKIHLIDSRMAKVTVQSSTGKGTPPPSSKKPLVLLNEERMKNAACAEYRATEKTSSYASLKKFIRKHIVGRKSSVVEYLLSGGLRCGLGVGTLYGGTTLLKTMYDRRHDGVNDFYSSHGSNFAIGLAYMGFAHQCASAILPAQQKNLLMLALGGNALGNLYYEVDFGGNWQKDGKKKVVTDYADLSTGILGIATYAVLANALEKLFPINLKEVCEGF